MDMSRRQRRRSPRPTRRMVPYLDGLDVRQLPSGGLGPATGPFLAPGTILPRVSSAPKAVNPHTSINQFLSAQLGPGIDTIEQQVEANKSSSRAAVAQKVLGNAFVHSVLSRQDTYTLLNSLAAATLPVSGTSTAGTTAQSDTVTYQIPEQAVIEAVNIEQTTIDVLPANGLLGFIVNVPTANVRISSQSPLAGTVAVPVSSIPANGPQPSTSTISNGPLTDLFTATGPIILSALRSSVPRTGPNAPPSVPGLRLVGAFANNHNFPAGRTVALLHAFRVAVDRNVFALSSSQSNAVNNGLVQFEQMVAALNQAGGFQPAVPPAAPALPRGPLYGTLEVSLGALRNLTHVPEAQTGLALPNVGNFPGRIDVGYIIDRNGNFGVALTARGPLLGAPEGVASADVVGGDVRVGVSNAPSLTALDGQRTVEGVTQGASLSGGIETSSGNGISTFATSAGYGSGLEFGTAVAFTQVIPLGNVYSLIPDTTQ